MRKLIERIGDLSLATKSAVVITFLLLSGGTAFALNTVRWDDTNVVKPTSSVDDEQTLDSSRTEKFKTEEASNHVDSENSNQGKQEVPENFDYSSSTTTPAYDSSAIDKQVTEMREADRIDMAKLEEEARAENLKLCLSRKQLLADKYAIDTNQLSTKHSNNLSTINSNHAGRGTSWSGMRQADIDAEKARYQHELASYENNYQLQLSSYAC